MDKLVDIVTSLIRDGAHKPYDTARTVVDMIMKDKAVPIDAITLENLVYIEESVLDNIGPVHLERDEILPIIAAAREWLSVRCDSCNGTGGRWSESEPPCPDCDGTGVDGQ